VSIRTRLAVLSAICVITLGFALAYLLVARHHQQQNVEQQPAADVAEVSLASVEAHPRIVFRNTAPGASYGTVAMVPLDDPSGPRAMTSTPCERVYATSKNLICLSSDRGFITTYGAHILDNNMQQTQALPFVGIPSRARLSSDGGYAATTSFTSSDSYASLTFSTRTYISRVGGSTVGNLEDFTLIHDGQSIKPVDRNYWGVTFAADDDTFYATVRWSNHTWLVRGSIARRTMVTLHEDAECPSLSPDGKNIVYKQRGDLPLGSWRLVDYNLASGTITPLAETRSVDDQVEWLDDSDVIYGLPHGMSQNGVVDVWSVPISGTGKPTLLIPEAASPAVVR
jgi:hypothetical protein